MNARVSSASMQISNLSATEVTPEAQVYSELLPLEHAVVIELGCGRAEHTRAIAKAYPRARITAFEVDKIQFDLNTAAANPPNLKFNYGGAEAIDAPNNSADIVLMFKSLHHVPRETMGRAMQEVARVLRPGGFAYISEPVFAGEFNEIMRIFNNEEQVRIAAFDAIRRVVESGALELVAQRFFLTPVCFRDFAEFESKIIRATHSNHKLTEAHFNLVKVRFERHVGPDGAKFNTPTRADLLRKLAPPMHD